MARDIFERLLGEADVVVTGAADCGSCTACLDACPTDAIVAPGVVDANRCISWILQKPGSIPVEFRQAIGNRIYGCDDCQLYCPWNRYASHSAEPDFEPRGQLAGADLLELGVPYTDPIADGPVIREAAEAARTAAGGHFGRNDPDFTWEKTDAASRLNEQVAAVASA